MARLEGSFDGLRMTCSPCRFGERWRRSHNIPGNSDRFVVENLKWNGRCRRFWQSFETDMDYDIPTMANDEIGDADALPYRVVSVWQSTQFVRRRGRRIQTELTLLKGSDRVAVRVDDVQYTGATKAARAQECFRTPPI